MEAKKISLTAFVVACALSSQAQTLFVPSGTAGIGSSTTGNVGVGPSNPQATLHLTSAGSTYIRIDKSGGSWEGGIQFNNGNTPRFFIFSDNIDNDALKIEAAGLAGEDDSHPRVMFPSDNKNLYMALSGGKVGIGTTAPSAQLHITSYGNPWTTSGWARSVEIPNSSVIKWAGNANSWRFGIGQSDGGLYFVRNGADDMSSAARYDLFISEAGKVGIGTTQPDYPLTVNGSIHAKEVRVDLNVPAPDYVFEKDYKLHSLEDIKTYIDQNKHLPEVPSAKEIEKNGVQLGEMNMILLKKIEELTLYLIELKKENEKQQAHIENLETKMESVKNK